MDRDSDQHSFVSIMPNEIPNDDLERIRAALTAGNKIQAIKLYREATGAGLAEAKKAVEAFEVGGTFEASPSGSPANEDINQIQAAVFAGTKIKAIKLHRQSTGMGLKESKEFIERSRRNCGGSNQVSSPRRRPRDAVWRSLPPLPHQWPSGSPLVPS